MTIDIGCSGWSYKDWIDRFYPRELSGNKSKWLSYYSRYFSTVEINSTFYRIPGEKTVDSWVGKASEFDRFKYSLKLPRLVTHNALIDDRAEAAANQCLSFENLCIFPLMENGLMGSALIQLSPYFEHDAENMHKLSVLLDTISSKEIEYAVEFRHRTWLDGSKRLRGKVSGLLSEHNVANVTVDGPSLPVIEETTADHAYVRFHGRNYDIWYREPEEDHRINRYDYLYSDDELKPWAPRLSRMGRQVDSVRVYFNNHGRAKAVKNASQMMSMLSIPHQEPTVRIQDQMTLGEY